jgi:phosphoadenosine phosphosulfate reductase
MKPIFEEEKKFIEERIGLKLPNNCWRDGKTIYLNCDKDTRILTFTIEHKQIKIKKNFIDKVLNTYENKTLEQEIEENKERLDQLESTSIKNTIECMEKYPNHNWRISDSSGKDSAICMKICQKAMKQIDNYDYDIDFFNTTNDTADTYKTIKQNIKNTIIFQLNGQDITKEEMNKLYNESYSKWVHNPEMGWYQWLKEVKHYYLPSIMVRNCCSTYKEGKLKEILDKKKDYVLFLGMRKFESSKRSHYDWYLNEAMDEMYEETKKDKYKINVPRNWVRFLPIVEWKDEDIWMYMLREGIEFNPMYKKGFGRVGCLLCPFSGDYNDLLIEYYYPLQWDRWSGIVEKNYDLYNVETRLKWTKEEYIQEGKWKQSTSKIQEYITKKATPERIKIVAELLGASEEIAEKYFKQKCKCDKKLNPDEVAMFLKLYGRYEGEVDERVYLCKDCLYKELGLTKDEYSEKVREFREQGCNLF